MVERRSRVVRTRYLVLIVFVAVWGLIMHGTRAGSGDEPHYLVIAHSLAFDADLDLVNNYQDPIINGAGTTVPGAHARVRDNRLRPVHDIGMPLAFAPFVRLAYPAAVWLGGNLPRSVLEAGGLNPWLLLRHFLSLAMALLTGLLARELFLILLDVGGSARAAFLWALLFALTPPILSHSFLFFTEIPTALVTLFVFRRLSLTGVRTTWMAAIVGGLAGFLLLVHARNLWLVVGLMIVAAVVARRGALAPNMLAAFFAAVAMGSIARCAVTFVMWGSLFATPHVAVQATAASGGVLREIFVRASGLIFDREYGLLACAPLYALAAPGFLVLARLGRRPTLQMLSIVLGCAVIPVLLPMINAESWRGGSSPAARLLVPVAPLLWVGVYVFAIHASTLGKVVAGVLLAWQIGIDAFVWQFPKTLWNDGDGVTELASARWMPSWMDTGATLPFALVLAMACVFTWACSRYAFQPAESL